MPDVEMMLFSPKQSKYAYFQPIPNKWLLQVIESACHFQAYIDLQQSMDIALPWLVFCSIVTLARSAQPCTTEADCTLAPKYSFCNPQGFCQCQNGYIFNCSVLASSLFTGPSTLSFPPLSKFYYMLSNITNEKIDYLLTLTDKSQTNLLANYILSFYIDEGIGITTNQPTGTVLDNDNEVEVDIEVALGMMPGTTIPEELVMMIENRQKVEGALMLNYNFKLVGNHRTLLIIAYAVGVFCICVTIVLMIVVYRKRRLQRSHNNHQPNAPIDISHFDTLMPITHISVRHTRRPQVCSVCLQEFQLGAPVRKTVCGHIFHSNCIDMWCVRNLVCPMCRTDLTASSILLVRSQNNKKDNQSSWIKNSISDQPQYNEEMSSPEPPHSLGLRQPFLEDLKLEPGADLNNDEL